MSWLSAAQGMAAARLLRQPAPVVVGWALTDRCNASCTYCHKWRLEDPAELLTHEVLAILDQLAGLGTRVVSFSGGEPLLREDIGELLRHANRLGLRCSLNTNGRLVPQAAAQIAGLTGLTISLDGPRRVNDELRGEGSYQAVLDATLAAEAHGIPYAFVTVLSRVNLPAVDFMLHTARRHRTTVTFQPVDHLVSRSDEPHPQAPPPGELRETLRLLDLRASHGAPVGNTRAVLEHLAFWPGPRHIGCAGGKVTCNIEADGRMYACSRVVADTRGQDCRKLGCAEAFRRIVPVDCGRCWCARRVELDLLWSLSPRALVQSALRLLPGG